MIVEVKRVPQPIMIQLFVGPHEFRKQGNRWFRVDRVESLNELYSATVVEELLLNALLELADERSSESEDS